MERISWRPEYNLGIAEIDAQHKQLVRLAQDLQEVVAEGTSEESVRQALDAMIDYAEHHFATEEKLFDEHGYPEAIPHSAEHDLFVLKLNRFRVDMEVDWYTTGLRMLEYLILWIKHHLTATDQAYAPYLCDRGAG